MTDNRYKNSVIGVTRSFFTKIFTADIHKITYNLFI